MDLNQFGTNEFVQFCSLVGAQPYLAANVRSLPAQEFITGVKYCNSSPKSNTLSDTRAAAEFPEPFNVNYRGRQGSVGMDRKPGDHAREPSGHAGARNGKLPCATQSQVQRK